MTSRLPVVLSGSEGHVVLPPGPHGAPARSLASSNTRVVIHRLKSSLSMNCLNRGARHESEALPYGGIERAPIGRFLG